MARKGENITKRKDGRWEARVIKGHDLTGKARYQYLYAKTYTEVRRKKEEYLRTRMAVTARSLNRNLLFSEIASAYLCHVKNEMKESSFCRYSEIIQKHISPFMGEKKVDELSTQLVDAFTEEMRASGRLNGSGGLSPKRINDVLSVLKQMLLFAEKQGCHVQPLQITHPKMFSARSEILSDAEEEMLVSYLLAKRNPMSFGVIISLYTGMRIGELCALRWGDVDLQVQLISVCKTIQRIPNDIPGEAKTKILITSPKTQASIRRIPIPSFLQSYFACFQQMAADPAGYVLTGTEKYIEPSNYYVKYQAWLNECGLERYSFHALRHTFATRCIENGFDAKALSEILGHSDVRVTLSRYVHPTMEHKRVNMERLLNLKSSQVFSQSV